MMNELTAADFEGCNLSTCECESCGAMTACVDAAGAFECKACLASNYLKGEAETSMQAIQWAGWAFHGATVSE